MLFIRCRRIAIIGAFSAGTLLLTATPALAHVTVHSDAAAPGAYALLTFRVPTERDDASTTALQVNFPTDTPIASVSVQPHEGWTFKVTTTKLATPIVTHDGSIDSAVSQVTWTADSAETAIKPGEFDQFAVSAGPLPDTTSLSFPALQTYSDGQVVKWIETALPGAAEPAHPAPTLRLAVASTSAPASGDTSNTTALALSIAALVVAAAVAAYSAIERRWRRRAVAAREDPAGRL